MHIIIFKAVLSYTSLLWALGGIQYSGGKDEINLSLTPDTVYVQRLLDSASNNIKSFDIALRFAEESLGASKKINYKRGAAQSHLLIGDIYYQNENFGESIKHYATSLEMYHELGDFEKKTKLLDYIGLSYYMLGEFKNAIEQFEHGLRVSDSLNNESSKASFYNKIGACYEYIGEYGKSFEAFSNSLEIYEKLGERQNTAGILVSFGVIYKNHGELNKAQEYFRQALEIFYEFDDKFGISTCLNNMGETYVDLGEYTKAIEYIEKSLAIERELQNKHGISTSLHNIGDCYLKLNKNQMALDYLTKALEIAEEIDNKMIVSGCLYNLGLIAKGNNDFIKAIQYGERSRKIAKISGNISNFLNACELLSNTYAETKQFEKAYIISKKYHEVEDSIFTNKKNKQILAITKKYETEKKQLEIIALKKDAEHLAKNEKTLITAIIFSSLFIIALLSFIIHIRKSRKILDYQRKHFEALITFSENNIAVIDKDAKIKYFSPSLEKKLGRGKKERIGFSSFEHVHPDDLDIIQKALKNIMHSKEPTSAELRVKNIAGEWNDMALIANNLLDEPFVNGIVINIWDITERKQTEKLIFKSEEKYRSIFNAFYDVYYQLTMDGVIIELTPSIDQIGYTREELIGTNIENLYPKDMGQDILHKKLAIEKQVTDYDIVMLSKDKQKLNCAVTARVLYDDKGKALKIEGVVRDITKRVKILKALKKSEKKLIKSNQTNKKILSIVSHDLLGPIATNKEMTDLIIMNGDEMGKDDIIDLISSLKPVMDSTYTMAENILSWAGGRKQKIIGKPGPIYLKPMIEECFSLYSAHASAKAIDLCCKGKENITVLCEENQIAVVFRNLISNAIKFTGTGGQIIVDMKEGDGFTEVSVADTGIGMSKEQLSGLFNDSFEKKSRPGTNNEKGTGLGLTIVKEFIKLNNGTIKAESKEGIGTTFTVTLPTAT